MPSLAQLPALPFLGWLLAAIGGLLLFLWFHPRREAFLEVLRRWRKRPLFLPLVFAGFVLAHLVTGPSLWRGMEPVFFPVPTIQESDALTNLQWRACLQSLQQWAVSLHRVAPVSILSLMALGYALWQFLMQPRRGKEEDDMAWAEDSDEGEKDEEPSRWRSLAMWLLPLFAIFHAIAWIAWLSRTPQTVVSPSLQVLQYLGLPFECLVGVWLQRGLLHPPDAGPVFPAKVSWFVQCLPLALAYSVISLGVTFALEAGPRAEAWVVYWWIPQGLLLCAAFPWLIFNGVDWGHEVGADSLRMLWDLLATFLWLGLTALILLTSLTLLFQTTVLAQSSSFWAATWRALTSATGGIVLLWIAAAWQVALEKNAEEVEEPELS